MTRAQRQLLLPLAALVASLPACADRGHPTAPAAAREDASSARAPTAAVGYLELCKEAGGGIAAGAPYDFTVALGQVVRSVELAAGACIRLAVPREGTALSKGGLRTRAELRALLLPAGSALQVAGAALGGAEVQLVLDAPSKGSPSVDVGGDALLLNLAQQLVAAALNVLRGVQPPPQVASAIATASAGVQIDVLGPGQLRITTTLSTSEMSALVDVLSRFNEGKLKGAATPAVAQLGIVELVPANVLLDAVVCAPAASCANADLGAASVTASVTTDGTTRVTFRNRHATLGTLRLCKVAGTGVAAGTAFTFSVSQAGDVVVEADEACLDVVLPPENAGDSDGRYGIFEHGCGTNCLGGDDGFAVVSIACAPAERCGSASEGVGTVRVGLAAGEFTTVTYTNRSTIGTLRLCKVGGAGIAAGTPFKLQVTDLGAVFVAAGDCTDFPLPERTVDSDGKYGIAEYGCGELCLGTDGGFVVQSIVCAPADRCSTVSEGVGVARAGLEGGSTTTVTFTNRSVRGTLRLCKVAGPGIAPGRTFGFDVAAPDVADPTVAAGQCTDITIPEGLGEYGDGWYRVGEKGCGPQCTLPDLGFAVSAITCVPADRCRNASLALGLVDFAIVATETTTITYTNRSTIGTLRLCKVAGTGITPGTPFTFAVPTVGDVIVFAGFCAEMTLREVNAGDSDGRYGIAEYGCGALCLGPDGGFVVESIVCEPAALCSSLSTAVGSVRVGLVGAQTTTVTFTNRTFAPD